MRKKRIKIETAHYIRAQNIKSHFYITHEMRQENQVQSEFFISWKGRK